MEDRALQALVKIALEPQWEARFEPNSYGFRPGRSAWDAIGAIYVAINQKAKYVLDADIEKFFDRIGHQALLDKLNTLAGLRRQIKAWLVAGVIEDGELLPTEAGTPQGGVLSPLLANIALHGIEEAIREGFSSRNAPIVVRYADDLVVIHPQLDVIERSKQVLNEWLGGYGLRLKASKTRIAHTLELINGQAGFDFLGFNIRQYLNPKRRLGFKTIIKPAKKSINRHTRQIREVIGAHRAGSQPKLIMRLNLVISGWSRYYSRVCSKGSYNKADLNLLNRLRAWMRRRHPNKSNGWRIWRYFRREAKRMIFGPKRSKLRMRYHSETKIRRHMKVQGKRSPYDGERVYWSARLGHHPEVSRRVAMLLKRQEGKCAKCGMSFKEGDLLEVDHIIPKGSGGRDEHRNWQVLHRHCHDEKTAEENRRCA
jgi:RNA-directed DNA polymerase